METRRQIGEDHHCGWCLSYYPGISLWLFEALTRPHCCVSLVTGSALRKPDKHGHHSEHDM